MKERISALTQWRSHWGSRGAECPLTAKKHKKKMAKIRGEKGKIRKKREKFWKRRKSGRFFHFALS